jgi:hypothetical protein
MEDVRLVFVTTAVDIFLVLVTDGRTNRPSYSGFKASVTAVPTSDVLPIKTMGMV